VLKNAIVNPFHGLAAYPRRFIAALGRSTAIAAAERSTRAGCVFAGE
jgi:hypothetical protein